MICLTHDENGREHMQFDVTYDSLEVIIWRGVMETYSNSH